MRPYLRCAGGPHIIIFYRKQRPPSRACHWPERRRAQVTGEPWIERTTHGEVRTPPSAGHPSMLRMLDVSLPISLACWWLARPSYANKASTTCNMWTKLTISFSFVLISISMRSNFHLRRCLSCRCGST
jgi:hypothetical protein